MPENDGTRRSSPVIEPCDLDVVDSDVASIDIVVRWGESVVHVVELLDASIQGKRV